jgi:tetratricopeptide (TPR) repeat protein
VSDQFFLHSMNTFAILPATLLGLLFASHASAASDHALLMKAKKYAEAERAASAVLAKDPANPEALAAKTEAILAAGQAARIDEAVKLAKQCATAHANHARCQVAVGKALGVKAMNGGMMSAMGYAGDIRDSFKKAVELDPRNLDARFSLLQYYIMAPGIVGGGTGKGETLAAQTAAINPEAGKLMLARLDIAADKLPKAEAAALAVKPGADFDLELQQQNALTSVGFAHMKAKRYTEAERVFGDTFKRFPDSDDAQYGLARAMQEQGRHREALSLLESLITAAPRSHVQYRMAKSLQALGDKPKAIAAFEKALAYKGDLPSSLKSDAEDQLKAIKG